jgi:hypothetical protein
LGWGDFHELSRVDGRVVKCYGVDTEVAWRLGRALSTEYPARMKGENRATYQSGVAP